MADDSLRVALASRGDWERDFVDLFALESLPPPVAPRPRENPYERRRRLETTALQATIRDLQRMIEWKHERADERDGGASREARALRAECRGIVARQADVCVKAKIENEKLRKAVETQRKDALRMERLVKRAAQLGNALSKEVGVTFDQYKGPKRDPMEHAAELEEVVGMAEEVFSSPGFVKRDRETYREVQLHDCHPDATDGIGLDLEMGWVLPFDVDDVTNALWAQATRLTTVTNSTQFMDVHEEQDVLVSQFISTPLTTNSMPLSDGQITTRRLPTNEKDGSRLIVSTVYVHNFEGSHRVGDLRGKEWLRIARVAQSDSIKTPLSRVKWCRRARIRPIEYDDMNRPQRAKWIHSAITGPMHRAVEQNLDRGVQNVENILLSLKL